MDELGGDVTLVFLELQHSEHVGTLCNLVTLSVPTLTKITRFENDTGIVTKRTS